MVEEARVPIDHENGEQAIDDLQDEESKWSIKMKEAEEGHQQNNDGEVNNDCKKDFIQRIYIGLY